MKNQEITGKQPKTAKIAEKQVEAEENGNLMLVLGILASPFYLIWMGIYYIFLYLPGKQSRIFGLLRATLIFFIISHFEDELFLKGEFANLGLFFKQHSCEFIGTILTLVVNGFLFYSGIVSLLMIGGFNSGLTMEDEGTVRFPNIKEAFDFRGEIMGQLSTTNKMNEMAKTGWDNYSRYENSMTKNELEATEYREGDLGQYSTSGKLKRMEELYSGKK